MAEQAYINGNWLNSAAGKVFEVRNPYNEELVASVTDCTVEDVRVAIDAAHTALSTWKEVLPRQKSDYLRKIGDLMLRDVDELGALLTRENGKPLAEAKGEVKFAASFFHWFAEETRRSYGEVIPSPVAGKQIITVREPLGVAALVCPWNFPIGMPGRKISAALAAGCTCVLKPAEDTPLISIKLVKLIEEAGIPKGVVNVVPCSRDNVADIGTELAQNNKVAMISFTGSCEVGQHLYSLSAKSVKRVGLELGGNAPFIVFSSADMGKAVSGLMAAKFRNTGQTCVTANRILVQDDIYDQFLALFKAEVEKLKVGDGMVDGVNQGPLINLKQQARVDRIVQESRASGATVLLGGNKTGNGFQPTILTDVTDSMACWKEEIFGPVASLAKFSTEEEAVRRANDCDRGLAAYFFSKDFSQVQRVSSALEAGMVGVNDVAISAPEAPFGGYKTSGIGKEGSKHGLDEYSNLKMISMAY